MEALEGKSNLLHVVDLGMTQALPHGHQWRLLIQTLASRTNPIPNMRILGVASADRLQPIGDDLQNLARTLSLHFEFLIIESNLENFLTPKDFEVKEGEIVIINSIFQLHREVKEIRGALNSVLQTLHEFSPKLMIIVEQYSSHNGPLFSGRSMEALHYYSAIFDLLDIMLPKYDTRRAKIEHFIFLERRSRT